MWPADDHIVPPTGDIAPYPNEALDLGNGTWLANDGKILSKLKGEIGCDLTDQTLHYWESAAIRGGRNLGDLIA